MYNKHQLFAEEFLKCFNGTKAYLAFHPNIKIESARQRASVLLARPEIHDYIVERLKELAMSNDELYSRLANIARNGSPRDQLKALELIAKLKGAFVERHDITSGGKPIQTWADFMKANGLDDVTVTRTNTLPYTGAYGPK
jgi:phage terminase small subunit